MPRKIAPFLDTARAFYGDAFDVHRKRELAQSMADWSELSDDEQRFTIAHLLFLNLEAQAGSAQLATQTCVLLNELAEAFAAAIELSLPPEPEDDDEADDVGTDDDVFALPPQLPEIIDAPPPTPDDGGAP